VIEIARGVSVSEHELNFVCDRSPGPGGQNVNKVNTRVTLLFDVEGSLSLSQLQKKRVRQKLATRINSEGVLRISSSRERTQLANRRATVNRFIELMKAAFHTPRPRRATRPSKAAVQRRLDTKKQRGALKRSRQKKISPEND